MHSLAACISQTSREVPGASFTNGTKVPSRNAAIHTLVMWQPGFVATFRKIPEIRFLMTFMRAPVDNWD
jgi:hypothetical protein